MPRFARIYIKDTGGGYMDTGPYPDEWRFEWFIQQARMEGGVLNRTQYVPFDQIKFALLIEGEPIGQVINFPKPVS